MSRQTLVLRVVLSFVAVIGCGGNVRRSAPLSASSNVLTRDEILATESADALSAVRRLRGHFLTNRGPTSLTRRTPSLPVVYLDGVFLGELATLAQIPCSEIAQIRLYRSWEAPYKFGRDKTSGVIEVLTYVPVNVDSDSSQATPPRPPQGSTP